ncbi:hypothetical protein O6H91_Y574800 [Diphasiastrum complanatum]|nr:hypothetical protein O6H91_Y574800 [Diphasiastrum complanatum]
MSLTIFQASWIRLLQGRKVSMYLRLLIIIVFSRALRGCFRMTLRIVQAFLDVVVMLMVFMLLSSWLASLVLKDTDFENYPTALLRLFILLTASDDSSIWASTYRHRIAVLFLLIYTIIGILVLMNVVFAVIYTNFKAQMEAESNKQLTARQGSLRAAFSLLDTRHQEWIDGPTMIALFLAIGKYRHIPDVRSQSSQLFLALNKRGDFKIWSDDFEDLCDVIAKEVQKRPKPASFSNYHQSEIMWVIGQFQFVKGALYDYFLWVATVASVIVALYERNAMDSTTSEILGNLELMFGCLFLIDCIIKILVLGFHVFWKNILNCFDIFSAAAIMGLLLASYVYPAVRAWVPVFLIIRSFRAVVLLSYIPRWRLLYQTLLRLVPATASIIGLQFCICSLFSLLGVHLFQGLVYVGNPKVEGTEYAKSGLWMFNYNDYASAHATSFSFFTVSSWYIIMEGYTAATGSKWSRLYFISFWAIAVAFTLNAMSAFFVETYTLQLEKAKALVKASAEQKRKEAIVRSSAVPRMRTVPGHFMILKKTASYHNFPTRR